MDGFKICHPRFARYILANARLEELACGFRWIEGPVWMGDAGCLLFQDLPNDRTMRWIDGLGASVYRAPSNYANGQTRDRQGRLISCSHRGRCLYRTEYDGQVTTLVETARWQAPLNAPNDVVVNRTARSGSPIRFTEYRPITKAARQKSEQPPAVYRFDPASGESVSWRVISTGRTVSRSRPMGAGSMSSEIGDQTIDDPRQYIRVFDVGADGLSLLAETFFYKVEPGY